MPSRAPSSKIIFARLISAAPIWGTLILYQVPVNATHVGDFQDSANMIHRGKRAGVCHGIGGSGLGGVTDPANAPAVGTVWSGRVDPPPAGPGGGLSSVHSPHRPRAQPTGAGQQTRAGCG